MSKPTLEERVARLEKQMADLLRNGFSSPKPGDWQRVVGMFTQDEVSRRVNENIRKAREADRRKAYRRYAASNRAKK